MRLIPYVRKSVRPARIWSGDSFFDEFFNNFLDSGFDRGEETWIPRVDVLEKKGNLQLRVEIPGLEKDDIDISLENNVLTLKGEKKHEKDEDNNNYRRRESFYGKFSRSFTLPEASDIDKIKADYKNGILIISIPQKPEAQPREIPVRIN
jgi:HSP20 family protein